MKIQYLLRYDSCVIRHFNTIIILRGRTRAEHVRPDNSICMYIYLEHITNSMAYEIRRFNAAFPWALQYSLSWAESPELLVLIQISLKSILIVSFHLRLGLPEGLFTVGLSIKILKGLLTSSILAILPAHIMLLNFITLTILGERYNLWSSSLWGLLHSTFASLLRPNIHLRILFPNTLSLRSSLNVRGHIAELAILLFDIFQFSNSYK